MLAVYSFHSVWTQLVRAYYLRVTYSVYSIRMFGQFDLCLYFSFLLHFGLTYDFDLFVIAIDRLPVLGRVNSPCRQDVS